VIKFCQKRSLAAVFICTLVWVLASCQSASTPQPVPATQAPVQRALLQADDNLQKVYVDEVPKALSLAAQTQTKLHVAGNLPSGAYKFDHTQVEVRGRVITLTPWAQYDPNVMAIQMLIPFSDSVAVGPLVPGEYEIRYQSRSGTQTSKCAVR